MLTTIRAVLSALLLLGFYVYALVVAGVFLALTAVASQYLSGPLLGKLILLTLAVPVAVLVATWRVLWVRPSPEPGLVIDEQRAPRLWAQVRQVAAAVGTRVPDEIRLVAEVNAAVSERTKLLGLIGGRRYLYVGVPLLQGLTVDQFRAVLAHEMGHYMRGHLRLGELAYRGGVAIDQTILTVGPNRLAGLLLRPYRLLYLLMSLSVRRRQEIEADQAAVRVAGRASTVDALRELPGLDAAWAFYVNAYVAQGLADHAPADILRSFPILLRERAEEIRRFRDEPPPSRRSRFDSHPPIAARIAAIEAAVPAQREDGPAADPRPATALLDDLEDVLAETEAAVFAVGGRARLPFAEYTAASAQQHAQHGADVLYRAAQRVAGSGEARLSLVLNLLGAGRRDQLAGALAGPGQPGGQALADRLADAFAAALVTSGAASWVFSWREPVSLRLADGTEAPISELVDTALAGRVAEVAERLGTLGVDLDAMGAKQTRATADGGEPIAAVVNIVVDKRRSDLLIYDNGLLVVPGISRWRMRKAKARVHEMLTAIPPEALASRAGHRFIPYEEIARCRLVRRAPLRYDLELAGGSTMTLRTGFESEEIGPAYPALHQALGAIGTRGTTPARG